MTKRMKDAYKRYLNSDTYSIYTAYGRVSAAKRDAWRHCEEFCREKHGKDLRVIGRNTNFFSAGFVYEEGGEKKFMFITHGGNYSEVIE